MAKSQQSIPHQNLVNADHSERNSESESSWQAVSWQRFVVPFEYPVYFTHSLFDAHNTVLVETLRRQEPAKRHRLLVFIDGAVADSYPSILKELKHYAQFYRDHIDLVTEPILLPGGETIKSDEHYIEQMRQVVADTHIDRHSYVMAIGGGAVLDAVGLVAATSHRGVRHIRVPTTVLAQNDSGVGVKNGINYFSQKNYLGTFSPPFAVLNDYEFIRCLPAQDKVAGMAEAVKVALIRDRAFFLWLENNAESLAAFNDDAMRYMIKRCAELHMNQIAQGGDPFETGSARPLDFGHWVAHKIETLSNYSLRHGEAVAIGIAVDTKYSVEAGLLRREEENRVCTLLERLGFVLWHETLTLNGDNGLQVLDGLTEFREHLGGTLTITLLEAVGCGVEVNHIDSEIVGACIKWLQQRHQR